MKRLFIHNAYYALGLLAALIIAVLHVNGFFVGAISGIIIAILTILEDKEL